MEFTLEKIKEILPHRYPFLFVDQIIEFIPETKAVGIKNITGNESYFQGHFPSRPIMPGVLIVEAMAQVGGIIIMQMGLAKDKLAVLAGIDNLRFRNMAVPGDQMVITAEVLAIKSKLGKIHAKAEVNNKIIAEGDILFSLVD